MNQEEHLADRMGLAQERQMLFRLGPREFDLSSRTHIMGVLNVTPDSFSDGGTYFETSSAVEHALGMLEDGADIIDVGGESTRPRGQAYGEGASPIPHDEEIRRVIPVIAALAAKTTAPISVDTYKSDVARRALEAGACIVNDISGFRFDPRMPEVVASAGATAVLMHIQGTPGTMQRNPAYHDLLGEVMEYLETGVRLGREQGITQMIIDPGLGFGKRQEHNVDLIRHLPAFKAVGCPVLVGPSRKTFVGNILQLPVADRLEGSIAAAVTCILYGANIVRMHDVKEAKRAALVADALKIPGTTG